MNNATPTVTVPSSYRNSPLTPSPLSAPPLTAPSPTSSASTVPPEPAPYTHGSPVSLTRHNNGTDRRYNLLSMDGGGVRGLCAAMVMDSLCAEADHQARLLGLGRRAPPPTEIFDLAGGTSTGGLLALMIFRLHLTTAQAREAYERFGESVFTPRLGEFDLGQFGFFGGHIAKGYLWMKAFTRGQKHTSKSILAAIDEIVRMSPYPEDQQLGGLSRLRFYPHEVQYAEDRHTLLPDVSHHRREKQPPRTSSRPEKTRRRSRKPMPMPGRMLICATKVDEAEAVTFRNYLPRDQQTPGYADITIRDAVCATTAAPLYLPKTVVRVSPTETDTFWDGGLLNNNPIAPVWAARYDLVEPVDANATEANLPDVQLVVSIGTGKSQTIPGRNAKTPKTFTGKVMDVLDYATNTWARHVDFLRDTCRENLRKPEHQRTHYFRFTPEPTLPDDLDPRKMDLDDYRKMRPLADMTSHWLARDDTRRRMACCARYMLRVPLTEPCICDACSADPIAPQVFSARRWTWSCNVM